MSSSKKALSLLFRNAAATTTNRTTITEAASTATKSTTITEAAATATKRTTITEAVAAATKRTTTSKAAAATTKRTTPAKAAAAALNVSDTAKDIADLLKDRDNINGCLSGAGFTGTNLQSKELLRWQHRKANSSAEQVAKEERFGLIGELLSERSDRNGGEPETGYPAEQLLPKSSSVIRGFLNQQLVDSAGVGTDKSFEDAFFIVPTLTSLPENATTSRRRKEDFREKKKKWVYKNTQNTKFSRLIERCADKVGSDVVIQLFGRLGRESGVKEYNALIRQCIEEAKRIEDEDLLLDHITKAFGLFNSMKEKGLQLQEQTYGPFITLLIEMRMVNEFNTFFDMLKDTDAAARLGYYEMLLAIELNDQTKISKMCMDIATHDGENESVLHEDYLMALCEKDRSEDLVQVLGTLDITRISSLDNLSCIFKSLGRLSLESFAEKFILELKQCDQFAESVSFLLLDYVTDMANIEVEEIIPRFKDVHEKLEVVPSCTSYEKLVKFFCSLQKAYEALDAVHLMHEDGFSPSIGTFNLLLHACEVSCEAHLVHRIYPLLTSQNVKLDQETCDAYRIMIKLCIKMKDFNTAKSMLEDLQTLNLTPTVNMYNAIIGGYYREGNSFGVETTVKEMEAAGVVPDFQTFCFLIMNCVKVDDINKYYEKLKSSGVTATKQVFMALINAYATCGHCEKAMQVISDKDIPVEDLNEVKSVLVTSLAVHGKMEEALKVYKEVKQAGCNLAPIGVISLIEHGATKEPNELLQFVNEVNDPKHWTLACHRAIQQCVKHKHLRPAVQLLNELFNKVKDELFGKSVLNEIFASIAEMDPPEVLFGLDLLQAVKEDLNLRPTRMSLDFLLSACINAKDLQSSELVWKEYGLAQLPYNVLSYLRMYQAYLASGDTESAAKIYKQIDKDDVHVRSIIGACQSTYITSIKKTKKVEKQKKKGEVVKGGGGLVA